MARRVFRLARILTSANFAARDAQKRVFQGRGRGGGGPPSGPNATPGSELTVVKRRRRPWLSVAGPHVPAGAAVAEKQLSEAGGGRSRIGGQPPRSPNGPRLRQRLLRSLKAERNVQGGYGRLRATSTFPRPSRPSWASRSAPGGPRVPRGTPEAPGRGPRGRESRGPARI